MDQLQQLNDELETVADEMATKATSGDLEGAQAAKTKADGIKTRIELVQEANGFKAWQNGEVPAQARNTSSAVKTAGGGSAAAGGAATKANVGKVEIDIFSGKVVQEEGAGILTEQQTKAVVDPLFTDGFKSWVRAGGDETKMKGTKDANSAFLEGRDSEGGHFVPPQIIAGMIHRDPTPTRIADLIDTIPVGSDKAQMIVANYDSDDLYSSAMRIYKTGEAQAAKKSDKPQFGLKTIDVHGWTAEISISKRLLEDSNFDIMGYFAEQFRTANRNLVAQKAFFGSGVGEHWGIFTRAGQAGKGPDIIKSGDANLLTWDSLRKIKNAVPEQYDNNCRYIFNKKSTLDAIEGFKDENGRDAWPEAQRAGGTNGAPGSLRGYPYSLEAFMPDIAANKYPVLFGDVRGYKRVFRMGMTIQVLREIEARNGQVVFLVEMREGGDLVEPWRMKLLQIAA